MTEFSVYIPRIHNYFTINDIISELSCYGKIKDIYKLPKKNYDDYFNPVIVNYTFTIPINERDGRTLKEDIIYRESNRLQPFIHWGKFGGWGLVRNLEELPLNTLISVNNDSIIYDDIYAAGL